jgi:hypothetical protein
MSFSIKSPCAKPWSSMVGDEQVRFCGTCEKHVYNLSAMTAEEVSALAVDRPEICVSAMLTSAGELLTKPCAEPVPSRRAHRFLGFGVGVAAAGAAWGAGEPAALTQPVARLRAWVSEQWSGPVQAVPDPNPRNHRNIVGGAVQWHDPNTKTL